MPVPSYLNYPAEKLPLSWYFRLIKRNPSTELTTGPGINPSNTLL